MASHTDMNKVEKCFVFMCCVGNKEKKTLQQDEMVQYLSADRKDILHVSYRNK